MTERRYNIKTRVGKKWVSRSMTVEEFRADLDARRPYTSAIADALRRGDIAGMKRAQDEMRARFP